MEQSTEQEIAERIMRRGVRWVPVREGLNLERCVDGREEEQVLGLPGGTLGEVIVTAVGLEQLLGRSLSFQEIEQLINSWPSHFGPIYLHTDHHGLYHLHKALGQSTPFDPASVEAQIRDPGSQRMALLEQLLVPAHMGCGHIKNMVEHARDYGADPALVRSILENVYTMLWNPTLHEQVNYVVIPGEHQEQGVLVVTAAELRDDDPASELPMVAPNIDDQQLFVYHPQLAHFQRRSAARIAHTLIGVPQPTWQESRLIETMETIGQQQLEVTLDRLVTHKPQYQAVMRRRGEKTSAFVRILKNQ